MPDDEIVDVHRANLAIVRRWRDDADFRRECAERAARQRGDLVPAAAAKLVRAMPVKPAPDRDTAEDIAAVRRQAREAQRRAQMQRDISMPMQQTEAMPAGRVDPGAVRLGPSEAERQLAALLALPDLPADVREAALRRRSGTPRPADLRLLAEWLQAHASAPTAGWSWHWSAGARPVRASASGT